MYKKNQGHKVTEAATAIVKKTMSATLRELHRGYRSSESFQTILKNCKTKDDEADLPVEEMSSGSASWHEWGMRIASTTPKIPGQVVMQFMKPFTLEVVLETKKPICMRNLKVNAWHNLFTEQCSNGAYNSTPLDYKEDSRTWDDYGQTKYTFTTTLYPTQAAEFSDNRQARENVRLTYYVVFGRRMLWADRFHCDCAVTVATTHERPSKAELLQISDNFWIGNSLSLQTSDEMNFGLVISLDRDLLAELGSARKLSSALSQIEDKAAGFKHFPIPQGAGNEIPEKLLVKVVTTILEALSSGRRVLVGSRLGRGRAASLAAALVYALNTSIDYEEAVALVSRQAVVYMHAGLEKALTHNFRRF